MPSSAWTRRRLLFDTGARVPTRRFSCQFWIPRYPVRQREGSRVRGGAGKLVARTDDTGGPPPEIRYRRALDVRTSLRELVQARPVMYSIAERDLRSRYSQMALGFAWDII